MANMNVIQIMDSKHSNVLPCAKNIHMFYYDGTAMTLPSMEHTKMTTNMEYMFEALKKDMILNGLETTTENIKKVCESYLDKWNSQLLASDGGDTISFKKMRHAWGKDASHNELYWCSYVWILENKCGVPSSDTFGYMGYGVNDNVFEAMTETKTILKCGNPSCDHRYPSMKKCSSCKKEHYCSA
jgi:hypothetical protein